jgi:hypothetical protein
VVACTAACLSRDCSWKKITVDVLSVPNMWKSRSHVTHVSVGFLATKVNSLLHPEQPGDYIFEKRNGSEHVNVCFWQENSQKGDVSKLLDRLRSTSPATVVGETRGPS